MFNNKKAQLIDIKGTSNLDFEVQDDCIEISFSCPTCLHSSLVKISDLFSILFPLVDKPSKDLLVSQWKEKGTEFVRQYQIKAEKDIKKGELVTFNVNIKIPDIINHLDK